MIFFMKDVRETLQGPLILCFSKVERSTTAGLQVCTKARSGVIKKKKNNNNNNKNLKLCSYYIRPTSYVLLPFFFGVKL